MLNITWFYDFTPQLEAPDRQGKTLGPFPIVWDLYLQNWGRPAKSDFRRNGKADYRATVKFRRFRRISSKLRNVEYRLILPLYTLARGPKLAGRVLGPSPAYLGLVSSKLRSPRKKRFSTKRQSGLESDGQISSISSFRRISSKLRNVEYQLVLPLYTPARGPKLAGRVLGSSPACLGPLAGV